MVSNKWSRPTGVPLPSFTHHFAEAVNEDHGNAAGYTHTRMASEAELALCDAICAEVFELFNSYPRFKDQLIDPLCTESSKAGDAYAKNYDDAPGAQPADGVGTLQEPAIGALVLRGPAKMLKTVAMVTSNSKAATTAERFKPLVSRAKWVSTADLPEEVKGIEGTEGLQQRFKDLAPARQFVAVVVIELESGSVRCQHMTGTGNASVDDRAGPWLYVLDHGRARTRECPKFGYNGSLVPYRVSPDRPVPAHIAKPDYYETGQAEAERRSDTRSTPPIHSEKEIKKMRKANLLGRQILDAAHRIVRPGVTTDEIDRVVHEYTIEHNAYPAPLHYFDFPKSVCTSVNEVVCHGIPDLRELQDGDIVNVDVSAVLDGYHTDLNETFCVGKNVSKEKKALIKATHDSLFKAIDMCKPGTFYRSLGDVITKHINGCGFAVDRTYCGHGIGQFFHCAPNIPHYAGNKAKFTMKPGHIFTIEPMVNMGTWRDTHWLDGWTAVTKDGQPSAQFEHTLLVTETGVDILTARLPTSPPLWWEADAAEAASSKEAAPIS